VGNVVTLLIVGYAMCNCIQTVRGSGCCLQSACLLRTLLKLYQLVKSARLETARLLRMLLGRSIVDLLSAILPDISNV
jgi:hypothetical protein